MKTGIFITARAHSSRLPNKHFLPCLGRPILEYLLTRIRKEFAAEITAREMKLVITSGSHAENKIFETLKDSDLEIFYGSHNNIPYRHLQAMKEYNLEQAVAVDGDDILCSTEAMRTVYVNLLAGHNIVSTKGLPLGMNVSGYKKTILAEALGGIEGKSIETGWGRIFSSLETHEIQFDLQLTKEILEELRLTLDYPEDFAFFETVVKALGESVSMIQDKNLIAFITGNKFQKINGFLYKQYWENFHRELNNELN